MLPFLVDKNIVIVNDSMKSSVLYDLNKGSAFEPKLRLVKLLEYLQKPRTESSIKSFCRKNQIEESLINELKTDCMIVEKSKDSSQNIYDTKKIVEYAKRLKNKATSKIVFYLTNQCNLRCLHCGLDAGKCSFLELCDDEWMRISEEAYKNGFRVLQLSGGEPLIRKKLVKKLVKKYHKKFDFISINTNALLIDKDIADFLAKYKNIIIYVSLYGYNKKSFKEITNRDLFSKANAGIKEITKRNIEVRASLSVINPVIDNIDKYKKYLKRFNIKKISYVGLIPAGRAVANYDKLIGSWKEYRKKLQFYINESENTLDIKQMITDLPWHSVDKRLIIYANGTTLVSEFFPITLGNVCNDTLSSILKTKTADYLLNKFNVDEIIFCNSCAYRYICKAICPSLSYSTTGDYKSPPPTCELALKHFYKKRKNNFYFNY